MNPFREIYDLLSGRAMREPQIDLDRSYIPYFKDQNGTYAEIRILKKDASGDIRDEDIGRLFEAVADSSLQFIVPGLFIRYY